MYLAKKALSVKHIFVFLVIIQKEYKQLLLELDPGEDVTLCSFLKNRISELDESLSTFYLGK